MDEVHERELNTDLLLILVKNAIATNPSLKVILMSATLDAKKISLYFGDCTETNVPGRQFHIDILHLEDVLMPTEYWKKLRPENQDQCIEMDVDDITPESLLDTYRTSQTTRIMVDHELLQHLIKQIHSDEKREESILVFLPGIQDINEQKECIDYDFGESGIEDYRLFILHSNEEIEPEVFEDMPTGIRKIILSKNIAEISVTIRDVVSS